MDSSSHHKYAHTVGRFETLEVCSSFTIVRPSFLSSFTLSFVRRTALAVSLLRVIEAASDCFASHASCSVRVAVSWSFRYADCLQIAKVSVLDLCATCGASAAMFTHLLPVVFETVLTRRAGLGVCSLGRRREACIARTCPIRRHRRIMAEQERIVDFRKSGIGVFGAFLSLTSRKQKNEEWSEK